MEISQPKMGIPAQGSPRGKIPSVPSANPNPLDLLFFLISSLVSSARSSLYRRFEVKKATLVASSERATAGGSRYHRLPLRPPQQPPPPPSSPSPTATGVGFGCRRHGAAGGRRRPRWHADLACRQSDLVGRCHLQVAATHRHCPSSPPLSPVTADGDSTSSPPLVLPHHRRPPPNDEVESRRGNRRCESSVHKRPAPNTYSRGSVSGKRELRSQRHAFPSWGSRLPAGARLEDRWQTA